MPRTAAKSKVAIIAWSHKEYDKVINMQWKQKQMETNAEMVSFPYPILSPILSSYLQTLI